MGKASRGGPAAPEGFGGRGVRALARGRLSVRIRGSDSSRTNETRTVVRAGELHDLDVFSRWTAHAPCARLRDRDPRARTRRTRARLLRPSSSAPRRDPCSRARTSCAVRRCRPAHRPSEQARSNRSRWSATFLPSGRGCRPPRARSWQRARRWSRVFLEWDVPRHAAAAPLRPLAASRRKSRPSPEGARSPVRRVRARAGVCEDGWTSVRRERRSAGEDEGSPTNLACS